MAIPTERATEELSAVFTIGDLLKATGPEEVIASKFTTVCEARAMDDWELESLHVTMTPISDSSSSTDSILLFVVGIFTKPRMGP